MTSLSVFHTDDDFLLLCPGFISLLPVVVHESPLAADIRFINFDGPFHLLTVQKIDWLAAPVAKTFPNTLQQEPCSRLGDFQLSTNFRGSYALRICDQHIGSIYPFLQSYVSSFHYRVLPYGKTETTRPTAKGSRLPTGDLDYIVRATRGTVSILLLRPSQSFQPLFGCKIVWKRLHQRKIESSSRTSSVSFSTSIIIPPCDLPIYKRRG